MKKTLVKYALRILPLGYMGLVWVQSGHFQPESVMHLSRYTLLSLGVLFEAAHLFQFGILYAALVVAALTFGPLTKRGEAFALLLSALYALLDEAHQYFVPFRSATLTDLAKDVVGVAVVWWAIRRSYRSQRSKLGQALRKCSAAFSKI